MSFVVAVAGATGNVGQEMLRILEQRRFPITSLVPLATRESAAAGRKIKFRGEDLAVRDLATYDFAHTGFVFMSAGAATSREVSPRAAAQGCIVIDNSSAFRMDPEVPLIVPEINGDLLEQPEALHKRILPVANCSTIQLVMALKPLHDAARIKRIVVDTYQSASGGGRRLLGRLKQEADVADANLRALSNRAKETLERSGDKPIAFNAVPHIDVFLDDGRTKEEWKMEVESRKILGIDDLKICATCVRVPVMVGHAEAVHVEFERHLSVASATELLSSFPGVRVVNGSVSGAYATPLDCAGEDAVFVSRIRNDDSVPHGLSFWVVADNIRKGAALNAVQIAEALIARRVVTAS